MKHGLLFCAILLAACGKKPEAQPPQSAPAAAAAPESDQAQTLERLTQAVRKYAAETRLAPKSLNELVAAGYLPEAPTPPAGKQYVIDAQLRVQVK
ncbi:MAG TPA: hypothetical protein VM680_01195 [Verrucomicrobiae bacterium]|nr:hypothetical protein [Verrucomicrobiae bacterium]